MIAKFKESLLELTDSKGMHPASEGAPSILLAVSGGIDSMCMAYLFSRIFYSNYAIATVNFSLRGEESDGDENLVLDWANSHGVKCFRTTFDTNKYAHEMGISTQMAARDLRYNWFDSLMKKHSFDYLAIAHNLNDSVETFFINILRGTGLQGLTGIRKKNGYVIRPLIGFTRMEIVELVKQDEIPFREDSTNAQSHYSRNRLRNLVFPELEMINPSFLKTVERDMANVEAAVDVLQDVLLEKKAYFFEGSTNKISIKSLLKESRPDFWLYEILKDYGFNSDQITQINDSLVGQSGKEFHSLSHLLIKDRDFLLLYPKGGIRPKIVNELKEEIGVFAADVNEVKAMEPNANKIEILKPQVNDIEIPSLKAGVAAKFECCKRSVQLTLYPKPHGFSYKKKPVFDHTLMEDLFSENEANLISAKEANLSPPEPLLYIDAQLLQFPLTLRAWKDGDRFMPLGMKGFKKLSDFMVDLKLDKISKNQIPILLSGDKIVAVIGYRIDERFKVTPHTKNIFEIKI